MDERTAINGTLSYASKSETKAYADGVVSGARAMDAAGRYELDAELTAIVNAPGSRGYELEPGVIVAKADVAAARAQVRKLIERDLGGTYSARTRFPGMR